MTGVIGGAASCASMKEGEMPTMLSDIDRLPSGFALAISAGCGGIIDRGGARIGSLGNVLLLRCETLAGLAYAGSRDMGRRDKRGIPDDFPAVGCSD